MSDLQLIASQTYTANGGATQAYTACDGQILVVTYSKAVGDPTVQNVAEFYRYGECAVESTPFYTITFGQGIGNFDFINNRVLGIWVNKTTQYVLIAYSLGNFEQPQLALYDTTLPQGSAPTSLVNIFVTYFLPNVTNTSLAGIDAVFAEHSKVVTVAIEQFNPFSSVTIDGNTIEIINLALPNLGLVSNTVSTRGTIEYLKAFDICHKDYVAVFLNRNLSPEFNTSFTVGVPNDTAGVEIYTVPNVPGCEPCIVTGATKVVDTAYLPGYTLTGTGGVSTIKDQVAVLAFSALSGGPGTFLATPIISASPIFLFTFDGHSLHFRSKVSAPVVLAQLQPTSDGKGFVAVTNTNVNTTQLNTYRLKDKCDTLILKAGQAQTLAGQVITNATLNDLYEPATFYGRYITVTTTGGAVQVFKVISCKC